MLPEQAFEKLSYNFFKEFPCIPLEWGENFVRIGMIDDSNFQLMQFFFLKYNKKIVVQRLPHHTILQLLELHYKKQEAHDFSVFSGSMESNPALQKDFYSDTAISESPIVRFVNFMIQEAARQGVSDVHIEPRETTFLIKYRVDGILHTRHTLNKALQQPFIARIKLLARLDITEIRLPQDGHAVIKTESCDLDIRISTLPTIYGERVVLRLLEKTTIHLTLEQLGIPNYSLDSLYRLLSYPTGIILITGPTGSGKTTSLYSMLAHKVKEPLNIMTIEDPVEYELSGISQMNIHQKIELSFSSGLKHILRQDPDVIMIGEIRDKETARIAIQASLTGHLVLSSLHTNDAASAVVRLLDMEIEPYLLASSLSGIIAQRLVRKICQACLGRGTSCEACFESGFKGRTVIYEMIENTEELKHAILQRKDSKEIYKIALKQGMRSLQEHAELLVQQGATTLQEVQRVLLLN